jgi:hypothetical protein
MNEVDIIPELHSYPIEHDQHDLGTTFIPRTIEPIIIRGAGHVTVFALNNKFDAEYPAALMHKVSRDEYRETIKRVNLILRKNIPNNFKW